MKKAIIFAAITVLSLSTFAQAKNQAETKKADTLQVSPAPQQFALILNQEEWMELNAVIGTSGKLTGDKINDYLKYLKDRRIVLSAPADTTKPKK